MVLPDPRQLSHLFYTALRWDVPRMTQGDSWHKYHYRHGSSLSHWNGCCKSHQQPLEHEVLRTSNLVHRIFQLRSSTLVSFCRLQPFSSHQSHSWQSVWGLGNHKVFHNISFNLPSTPISYILAIHTCTLPISVLYQFKLANVTIWNHTRPNNFVNSILLTASTELLC